MVFRQDEIDGIIREAMQCHQIPGLSIGLMHRGEVLIAKGYGWADLKQKVNATEHTVYRLGSITKQFTALAVMMLVESGMLRLDDDLTVYFPDYPVRGHRVSLAHLLNHTSGIKNYTEIDAFWKVSHQALSHETVMRLFSAEPFVFAPGENFYYNNSAYYLLGMIIEQVTGMCYAEFLRTNIWFPLEMFETYDLGDSCPAENCAEGYEIRERRVVEADSLNMANPFSGGSLGSSVSDLLKWQRALNDHRLITRESYGKVISPGTLKNGQKTTYGFGFFLSNMGGHRKIEHGGDINGFRAQLSFYPDDDLVVAVLCNSGSAPRAQIESRISRALLGIPEITVREISMLETELRIYARTYEWLSTVAPGPFSIVLKDGKLYLAGRRLCAIQKDRFVFADDPYAHISFTVEHAQSIGLKVEREGQEITARQID